GTSYVIGFDTENKLVLGMMTPQKALEMGVRDAVSFGPIFIVNGKRTEVSGSGGGLNPRTCIGQRADGTVLLLVIDGRQATSLGATYDDCINIMEEYGAVNAANLDGGSSTMLFYEGKIVNECASVYGPRKIPTAFVVK
ncbi:MAG: phosphodiester glycosidase family protein, partial [Oscillospiraceae bacterium]